MPQTRKLSLRKDTLADLTPSELTTVGGAQDARSTFTTVIITRKVPTWWECPVAGPTLPVEYCDTLQ